MSTTEQTGTADEEATFNVLTDEELSSLLWDAAQHRAWKTYDELRTEWRRRYPINAKQ